MAGALPAASWKGASGFVMRQCPTWILTWCGITMVQTLPDLSSFGLCSRETGCILPLSQDSAYWNILLQALRFLSNALAPPGIFTGSDKVTTSVSGGISAFPLITPGCFSARTGTGPTLSDRVTFWIAEDVFLEILTNFLPVESTAVTPYSKGLSSAA